MTNVITIHNMVNERCWQEVMKWEQLHKVREGNAVGSWRLCIIPIQPCSQLKPTPTGFRCCAGGVRLPKVVEVSRAPS